METPWLTLKQLNKDCDGAVDWVDRTWMENLFVHESTTEPVCRYTLLYLKWWCDSRLDLMYTALNVWFFACMNAHFDLNRDYPVNHAQKSVIAWDFCIRTHAVIHCCQLHLTVKTNQIWIIFFTLYNRFNYSGPCTDADLQSCLVSQTKHIHTCFRTITPTMHMGDTLQSCTYCFENK